MGWGGRIFAVLSITKGGGGVAHYVGMRLSVSDLSLCVRMSECCSVYVPAYRCVSMCRRMRVCA